MRRSYSMRETLAAALAALLIATSALGAKPDGKKHFQQGLAYEANKQWDKAAKEYQLAVAENPSNFEYTMYLQRAMVNAGTMLSERGDRLAADKDYKQAYYAYREAFAYDQTNDYAAVKMRRMLEAQGLATEEESPGQKGKPAASTQEVSFKGTEGAELGEAGLLPAAMISRYVNRKYPPQDLVFRPMSLKAAIEQLAESMRLNVIFDSTTEQTLARQNNNFSVELRDMSPARALEIILSANQLMYSPVDTRTIIVANDNPQSRMRYERQAVRVFYIKNADITEVRTALNSTINSKQIVAYKQLNCIVIRDTPANLALADTLIKSLDKDKAEVLVDVNMYQISHNNNYDIGNQFSPGGASAGASNGPGLGLDFLGGFGMSSLIAGLGPRPLRGPFGIGLGLPTSTLSFFQSTGHAKLLASTQVHALDGEQHSVQLGQRVPIQTAALPYVSSVGTTPGTTTGTGTTGFGSTTPGLGSIGSALGYGIPQIQYENIGLTLDMTPTVFGDEVQMKMKVQNQSIDGSTSTYTPTFNTQQMQSVARIRDGQTTLVAGISQTQQSKSIKGMPFIGTLPIIGRLFATPSTQDNQSDVVITVTPHILRKADITGDDELTRDVGPESNPHKEVTIEQILYLADHQQDQEPLTDKGSDKLASSSPPASFGPSNQQGSNFVTSSQGEAAGVVVLPTSTSAQVSGTPPRRSPSAAQTAVRNLAQSSDDDDDDDDSNKVNPVQIILRAPPVTSKGQQVVAAVLVTGDAQIASANIVITFDPATFQVRTIRDGGLMNSGGVDEQPTFSTEPGVVNAQFVRPPGAGGVPARGQLMYLILDVKGKGGGAISLAEGTTLRTASGDVIPVKLQGAQVEVR